MNLPGQVLPPGFRALPADVRDRIVREGQQFGDRVASHVVQVLIGPLAHLSSSAPVNHASGIQILVNATRYLATAAHVVRKVQERSAAGERIITQIGNAIVPVQDRVAWWSESLDLAFIRLEPSESAAIPALCWAPRSWPPRPPVEGEYVAFAGFPLRYRENHGPGVVVLNAIGGLLRVESASDRRLTSVLTRPDLVLTQGPEIPPRGSELGGMSGGPVFRIQGSIDIELVALIKEDSQLFDAFFFAPFTDVVLDPSARVAV